MQTTLRVALFAVAMAASGCDGPMLGATEQAVQNAEIEKRKDAMCKVAPCEHDVEEVESRFDPDTGCESTWTEQVPPMTIDPEAGVCRQSFDFYFWELVRVAADADGNAVCIYERNHWSGTWTIELDACPAPDDGG